MLCELDVSFNKLQSLPASLGKLQRLVSFKASYNQLVDVGPGVRVEGRGLRDLFALGNRIYSSCGCSSLSRWSGQADGLMTASLMRASPAPLSCTRSCRAWSASSRCT